VTTIHVRDKQQWLRSNTTTVQSMLNHFDALRRVKGSGVKGGSCCAVVLGSGEDAYGNSQAEWLDVDARNLKEFVDRRLHAEVVAFELAKARRGVQPRMIFCELSPCAACQQTFSTVDVEIVYMFTHGIPDQMAQWAAFHQSNIEDQKRAFRVAAGLPLH